MDLLGPDFSKAVYWTEFDESGERLVMPIRRSLKVVGGALLGFGYLLFKSHASFGHEPEPLDYLIFAGLAATAGYLLINIATSLFAREIIAIRAAQIVHGWRLLGLTREKSYPLVEVTALRTQEPDEGKSTDKLVSPLFDFGKSGTVAFDYRGQTIRLGAALDEDHAARVVEWIARRGPSSITNV